MTREEFINKLEAFMFLTKNDIYELGQLYDEVIEGACDYHEKALSLDPEENIYIDNIIDQAFKPYADGTNDYEIFKKGFMAALDWVSAYNNNKL